MQTYPEKTCDIDRLIRHPKLVQAAIAGQKTQQRRDGVYAYPGETFTLEGVGFTVTAIERHSLGEMTDADANTEGDPGLEEYQELTLRMTWDNNHLVWAHPFEKTMADDA